MAIKTKKNHVLRDSFFKLWLTTIGVFILQIIILSVLFSKNGLTISWFKWPFLLNIGLGLMSFLGIYFSHRIKGIKKVNWLKNKDNLFLMLSAYLLLSVTPALADANLKIMEKSNGINISRKTAIKKV